MPLVDTNGRRVELDTLVSDYNAGYLVNVEIEHHKIHDGRHYMAQDYDADVDAAAPKYWLIIAPDTTTRCHTIFHVRPGGPGLIEAFSDPTTSANGTAVDSHNNDFNSSNTATLLFYYDPTVTLDGTRVCVNFVGSVGVSPAGAAGGVIDRSKEFILKRNSKMLIKFTPEYNDTPVSICIDWYEVPDNSVG